MVGTARSSIQFLDQAVKSNVDSFGVAVIRMHVVLQVTWKYQQRSRFRLNAQDASMADGLVWPNLATRARVNKLNLSAQGVIGVFLSDLNIVAPRPGRPRMIMRDVVVEFLVDVEPAV